MYSGYKGNYSSASSLACYHGFLVTSFAAQNENARKMENLTGLEQPMNSSSSAIHHPAVRYLLLFLVGMGIGALAFRSLAERPLWVYFTLIIVGLVPLGLFITNRRVAHLFGLIVIMALLAGVYMADAIQESDQEQVIRITQELVRAVERADYSVFERYLATDYRWQNMNRAAMMNRVRTALLPSESRFCGVSSAKVREPEGSQNLTVEGNLSASGRFGREEGFFNGTIELRYRKQPDGTFKVVSTRVAWMTGGEVTIPPGR